MILEGAADLLGAPVAWSTLSYRPLDTLAWLVFVLGLVLFFVLLQGHFGQRGHMQRTVGLLFGLAVLEALYGIVQALVPNLPVLWATHVHAYLGDARGTWVNRNHFAGFIAMLLPLCLGLILSCNWWREEVHWRKRLLSERAHRHVLLLVGLAIMALALLLSRSRGGIAAALVGFWVFLLVQRSGPRRRWPAIGGTLGFLTLLVAFYGSQIGFGPLVERFLAIDVRASRLDIWQDCLVIIAHHPFGIGPMSLPSVFKIYDASAQLVDRSVHQAHNDILQILVDTGWVGFTALVGGHVYFMARSFRRLGRMDADRYPQRFFLAAGALSGLSALTFHSFLDFSLQIPANAFIGVTLLAVAQYATAPPGSQSRRPTRFRSPTPR
jgi:hypothetical protein